MRQKIAEISFVTIFNDVKFDADKWKFKLSVRTLNGQTEER